METPAFIPLATKGTVKALIPSELKAIGVPMLMANTYHLSLQPGADVVASLGGLHSFMGWTGPIMTDSGGFQVFSMGHGRVSDEIKGKRGWAEGEDRISAVLRIGEEGILFRSYIDGSLYSFSPEKAMEVQQKLGTNIALVLDECTPYHAPYEYTKLAMERTHRWALRCIRVHERSPADIRPALFGIIQGGVYRDLREAGARYIPSLGFDGLCIGGSLGKDKEEMFTVVDWVIPFLPDERPRHLLGIGEPEDLLKGVERGLDLFDCAFPTRLARHGTLLVREVPRYRMDVTKAAYVTDESPPDPLCSCPTCTHFPRAYLHHLFRARELTGVRLATLHNLAWMMEFMREIRKAIRENRFPEWKSEELEDRACPDPGNSTPRGTG